MPYKLNHGGEMQQYSKATGEYGSGTKPNIIDKQVNHTAKKNVLANKTFYHGSPNQNIKQFDERQAGTNVQTDFEGIFFTDNKDFAEDFSYEQLEGSSAFRRKRGKQGSVYEVELEMNNPLDLNNLTEEQTQDLLENYMKDDVWSKEHSRKSFKEYMQYNNLQGAKMYIDFQKLAKDGKYDGYIADLGGQYKGSNEYVIFKGSQAKIKKENKGKSTTPNIIEKTNDDLPW